MGQEQSPNTTKQQSLIEHLTDILNISAENRSQQSSFQPKRLFSNYQGLLGPAATQFVKDISVEIEKTQEANKADTVTYSTTESTIKLDPKTVNIQQFVIDMCDRFEKIYQDLTTAPNWEAFQVEAGKNPVNKDLITDSNISGSYIFKLFSLITKTNPSKRYLNIFLQNIHSAYVPDDREATLLNLQRNILKNVVSTNVNSMLSNLELAPTPNKTEEEYHAQLNNYKNNLVNLIQAFVVQSDKLPVDILFNTSDIAGIKPELQEYYKATLQQVSSSNLHRLKDTPIKAIQGAIKDSLEAPIKSKITLDILDSLFKDDNKKEQMQIIARIFNKDLIETLLKAGASYDTLAKIVNNMSDTRKQNLYNQMQGILQIHLMADLNNPSRRSTAVIPPQQIESAINLARIFAADPKVKISEGLAKQLKQHTDKTLSATDAETLNTQALVTVVDIAKQTLPALNHLK